ncbi:MAG: hypothetical protein A3G34_14055 [Candidatus Lindowbacteria bacterium RIFCSPLOWO2_12_FULL_62_27]|nr:MAG: hypothetical protein A3I06_00560 [Candidatus Lindowbacteria bacterium RIFCSPLOWO2_02_FULL_62_12]OGH62691.1 MAG: hypothetical protein A3G34_14055 [Candidatus Lindowbacteria bacterium RIFCSPLOWO2_12_FULL_62_27]
MFRLRLKLLARFLSPVRTVEGRRNWLVIGIFLLFVSLTSHMSARLFDTLRLTPEIGTALTFRVVAMANLSFAVMLVFSSIVTAALILYSNPENEMLMALPIPAPKIFALRYLESMAASGWMVFLFGTPIAAGLGRSFVAGWEYVPLAALALLGLTVLPTALGVFILIAAFVCIPRHRAKALLFLVGALAAYTIVAFASRVDIGVLFKMEFDPALHLPAVLSAIEIPSHPFTPDTLAAQALSAWVKGEMPAAWKNLGLLWAENAVGVLCLMAAAYPLYLRGWARSEQRDVTVRALIPFSSRRVRGRPFLTLCLKDLKLLFRNVAEWTQLLVLLTLIFVQVVNIRDLPLDQVYLKNFVSFVNLAIAGLLVVAVSVRFVYPAFSFEGQNAYLLKTLPMSARDVLGAKFWTHAGPLLILSQLLLFVTNRQTGVSTFFFVFSHTVSAIQTLAIVMMAIHAALAMPPQSRSSLERAAGSTGGLLFMILGSLYIAACIAFFTAPIYKLLLTVPLSRELAGPLLATFSLFVLAHVLYVWIWRKSSIRMLHEL